MILAQVGPGPSIWLLVVIGLVIGIIIAFAVATIFYRTSLKPNDEKMMQQARDDANRLRQEAEKESSNILNQAKKETRQTRQEAEQAIERRYRDCLLYTSPSPRDKRQSRMPSSA